MDQASGRRSGLGGGECAPDMVSGASRSPRGSGFPSSGLDGDSGGAWRDLCALGETHVLVIVIGRSFSGLQW